MNKYGQILIKKSVSVPYYVGKFVGIILENLVYRAFEFNKFL